MKRLFLAVAVVVMFGVAALAAPSNLAWDVTGYADAPTAQTGTYRLYADGSATGSTLTSVTCSGTTTITCQTVFPTSVPNGSHTLAVSSQAVNGPESPLSTTTTVVVTGTGNVRLK